MELVITDQAHNWFKDELDLETGDTLRIFGKYGGSTNVHVGFSTGIQVVEPMESLEAVNKDGITYFTEHGDEWFFSDYILTVDLDPILEEPRYIYTV